MQVLLSSQQRLSLSFLFYLLGMPLTEASSGVSASQLGGPEQASQYLIFYSTRDESGRMWCGVSDTLS
jgi:hypothetical protein